MAVFALSFCEHVNVAEDSKAVMPTLSKDVGLQKGCVMGFRTAPWLDGSISWCFDSTLSYCQVVNFLALTASTGLRG